MVAFAGLAPALPLRPSRGPAPAARRRPGGLPPPAAAGGRARPPATATAPYALGGATPPAATPSGSPPPPGRVPPAAVPVVPAVAATPLPPPPPVTPVPAAATAVAGTPVAADKRVVVVGAGWAGLGAAHALAKAGHDVTLVDAADSVGGLVAGWRTAKGNKPVEVGVCAMGSGRGLQGRGTGWELCSPGTGWGAWRAHGRGAALLAVSSTYRCRHCRLGAAAWLHATDVARSLFSVSLWTVCLPALPAP